MNRIIKFRAWDKNGDGMFYNIETGIQFDDGSHYTFDKFLNPDADDIHDWEIMQFCGLHDKNGKEIFELDKISFDINFSEPEHRAYWSVSGFNGVVRFGKFGWEIKDIVFEKMYDPDYVFSMQGRDFDKKHLERYSKMTSTMFSEVSNITVIGNIYEKL